MSNVRISDLSACLAQVEASRDWFKHRVMPLTLDQIRWRPEAGRWSIAECLEHLNLTFTVHLSQVHEAVELAPGSAGIAQWNEREEAAGLIATEPPVTVRRLSSAATTPIGAVDLDRMVEGFYQTREDYAAVVRRSAPVGVQRFLIADPVWGLFRSLGGMLAFLAAHERRHMWQAECVRRARGFPGIEWNGDAYK